MVEANACLEETEEKVHCFNFFQFSPYWAHPEAILLALLSDENPDMRLWAVQKITEIRQSTAVPSEYFKDNVRTWKKVTLLYNPLPEHYKDMIDWNKENITEPPPTKHISLEDMNKIVTGEKHLTDFIPKVMSHSIANERCVQATSKKVRVRKGYTNVHTALLRTQKSISTAPYNSTKRHFIKLSTATKTLD